MIKRSEVGFLLVVRVASVFHLSGGFLNGFLISKDVALVMFLKNGCLEVQLGAKLAHCALNYCLFICLVKVNGKS